MTEILYPLDTKIQLPVARLCPGDTKPMTEILYPLDTKLLPPILYRGDTKLTPLQ